MTYPRDMTGYGETPPAFSWPGDARVAVQFVINYEEGGENCILHGDPGSEAFLSEIVGATSLEGVRNMNMESIYEFGSRAGFWRLHRIFSERELPLTVFAVASALERTPVVVDAMLRQDWEIASHGLRWIDYQYFEPETELEHLKAAMEIHQRLTGRHPDGFYLGRISPNTHDIVAEYGRFEYSADSYADELPYWNRHTRKPLLMVPYTLDANDMRFATAQGFNSGEQFFNYLKDSFDTLYGEGRERPRMMSIGLHCRLAGRPGRAAAVARFLDYLLKHDEVWITRRIDIARFWHEKFPLGRPGE